MRKQFVKPHQFTCEECEREFDYKDGEKYPFVAYSGIGYFEGACYYGRGAFGFTYYTTERECPFCGSEDITEYIRGDNRDIGITYKIVRVRKVKT